jgi:ABC-type antimicrobial peptide transport system permease subunit
LRIESGRSIDRREIGETVRRIYGPGYTLTSVASRLEPWIESPRLYAAVFGSFAVVEMLLVIIGLVAVSTFEVSRRLPEIGIRMALGATPQRIRRFIMLSALGPVGIGLALGAIFSYWNATALAPMLYEIQPRSPFPFVAVSALLLSSAAAAVWPAARKASKASAVAVLSVRE